MECPYGVKHLPCDYMIECEVQAEALNEAYEQYKEMSDEIEFLKMRIEQLERYICDAEVPIPNDLLLM